MNILISVIVPVYKVPLEYLRACLDSLIAQTMLESEFIVVSDGAPEAECSTCEEYAAKDTRFKFFKREHAGVSAARNYGIEQAKGEYITFLDSDDWIEKNSLSQLSIILKKKSYDALITSHNLSNDKNNCTAIILSTKEKENVISDIIFSKSGGFRATPWGKIFSTPFLKINSITFPTHLQLGEDRVFNYDVFSKEGIFASSKYNFYHYRERPESLSSRINSYSPSFFLPYIEELKTHSSNKYPILIAKETLSMLHNSWNIYFCAQKEYHFFPKRLIVFFKICFSKRIRHLTKISIKNKIQLVFDCLFSFIRSKSSTTN